jgi:hypothetical protein
MREIFTYGSVGGAPGNRCFYLEPDQLKPMRGSSQLLTHVRKSDN